MDPTTDILSSVSQEVVVALESAGFDHEKAKLTAEAVIAALQDRHGGDRCYVRAPDTHERDRQIIADWQAKVPRENIASCAGVTTRTVNRVISQHLSKSTKKPRRRSSGFGSDDWVL